MFVLVLAVILIIPLSSASWFGDFWNKITGNAVASSKSICADSDNTTYPLVKNAINDSSYFAFGNTTKGKTIKKDSCTGSWLNKSVGIKKEIKEYYCKKNDIKETTKTCPNGCKDGACLGNKNMRYNPYNFKFFDVKYYINSRSIQGCFVYNGTSLSNTYSFFINKTLIINMSIPNTSISEINYYTINENIWNMFLNNNQYCDSKLGLMSFYEEEVNELLKSYPNKQVPYSIQFSIDNGKNATPIYNEANTLYLDIPYDNRTYKIAVVQVLPPEMKLGDLKICFSGGTWSNNPYHFEEINANCPVLSGWDKKEVNFSKIFLSDNAYSYIKNVTYAGSWSLDELKIYSFKYIGDYWNNLLLNSNLTNKDTWLGKNPRFNVTFLTPIYKENTLHSDDNPIVRRFFSEAVAENKLNLSKFDYIIYVQYIPKNTTLPYFSQGFTKLSSSYVPIYLGTDNILTNGRFITLVHEMGHQLFPLGDLYSGLGISYPDGVPDPLNFPQRKACLMAESFGYKKISDNLVEKYDINSDPAIFPKGIDRNYLADPENQVLCSKDIFNILKWK
jgi:hypothetical protein